LFAVFAEQLLRDVRIAKNRKHFSVFGNAVNQLLVLSGHISGQISAYL